MTTCSSHTSTWFCTWVMRLSGWRVGVRVADADATILGSQALADSCIMHGKRLLELVAERLDITLGKLTGHAFARLM